MTLQDLDQMVESFSESIENNVSAARKHEKTMF